MAGLEEFNHESLLDSDSIVNYLNAIIEGFVQGQMELGTDRKKFTVKPQGLLKLSVKVKRNANKTKMNLKFSWTETRNSSGSSTKTLVIKTKRKK